MFYDYMMEDTLCMFYGDEYFAESVKGKLSSLGKCIEKVFFFSKAYPELNQSQINMKEIYKRLKDVGVAVDKYSTARTPRELSYLNAKISYAIGPILMAIMGMIEGAGVYALATSWSAPLGAAMAFPLSIPAAVVGGVLFTALYILLMVLTDQVFHLNDYANELYSRTINELQGTMRQCMQIREAAKKKGNKQMVAKCEKIILMCDENINKLTKERQGFKTKS